jgi:hypothetical protein
VSPVSETITVPNLFEISAVPSLEHASTTIVSQGWKVWCRIESRDLEMQRAEFRVGITIETVLEASLISQFPKARLNVCP